MLELPLPGFDSFVKPALRVAASSTLVSIRARIASPSMMSTVAGVSSSVELEPAARRAVARTLRAEHDDLLDVAVVGPVVCAKPVEAYSHRKQSKPRSPESSSRAALLSPNETRLAAARRKRREDLPDRARLVTLLTVNGAPLMRRRREKPRARGAPPADDDRRRREHEADDAEHDDRDVPQHAAARRNAKSRLCSPL